MTMMNSPFGLDDMEALLWGPSCPMADPTELLLHRDEVTSTVGGASPLSSSSSSPLPLTSPSPPTLLLQEEKTEADLQSLPWLAANELGHTGHVGAYVGKENAFCGLDWMSERVDLSEFDLDSLMGSCSPDGPPASPEDLPSFECPMELDSLPLSTPIDLPLAPCSPARDDPPDEIPSSPPCVPDPQEELEIKSEPRSPSPPPTFTLDLGSEVDLLEGGSPPLAIEVRQSVPRIVVSLSPTRIVVLLAPKQEVVATTTTADASFPEILSSDVGCGSRTFSSSTSSISTPPSRSHTRSKPYPAIPGPQHPDSPPRATSSGKMRSAAGGIPKERKLKKMEQNKTAATRYRQKKKTEQEALTVEYDELEKRNQELGERADSLAREIQYLRDLMEEVRQARSRKCP